MGNSRLVDLSICLSLFKKAAFGQSFLFERHRRKKMKSAYSDNKISDYRWADLGKLTKYAMLNLG